MSSVFEAVKAAVPVRAAAEKYGLEVNYAGIVRCPFHEDHTPSLKLYEDHFYCFGCGRHGDVVDLTAKLFSIPPYDAACRLADDFGLPSPSGDPTVRRTVGGFTAVAAAKQPQLASLSVGGTRSVTDEGRPISANARAELRIFREDQLRCQRVLSEYLRLLTDWKERFAPTDPDAEPDDRFVEACQMIETIDYLTDLLIVGTLEQRVKAVDLLLADGKIDQLEERLRRLRDAAEKETA